jgi:hypothetical protein
VRRRVDVDPTFSPDRLPLLALQRIGGPAEMDGGRGGSLADELSQAPCREGNAVRTRAVPSMIGYTQETHKLLTDSREVLLDRA